MKFKLWITLQDIVENEIHKAVETDDLASSIIHFVSTAIDVSEEDISKWNWDKVATKFLEVYKEMDISLSIPLFVRGGGSDKRPDWDYRGRDFFMWTHLLAKTYGWTIEYISELDHNQVAPLVQEIEVDNQLEYEQRHSLAEVAWEFDPKSKKTKYKPPKRPTWMNKAYQPPKKVKIPVNFLPSGVTKIHED